MSFPPPVVTAARHALRDTFRDLEVGAHVLLAVSGGADSMALAASAAFAARENAIMLHSLTVDHGLRPESADEAACVVHRLQILGIDARAERITLGAGLGPEGEARAARYAALAKEARRIWQEHSGVSSSTVYAVPVLLGHNANDQAETVLLGLARGSGARSVRGMPSVGSLPEYPDVPMMRPLLDMTSQSLEQVCRELGVDWAEDPTNGAESEWRAADGSMLMRSAIRHKIFPVLESVFGEGIVDSLVRTGTLLGSDDDALSHYAHEAWRETLCESSNATEGISLSCADLSEYPRAVRTRVLRMAALKAGARSGELFFSHISALDKLIVGKENNLQVDLPGARAHKNRGILFISSGAIARTTI